MARTDLPTGTVTFVFTDIEGSTRLLSQLGESFRAQLEEHQRILRKAFTDSGGVEVSTEGDAFFVAFPSAADAVKGAVQANLALASHEWPAEGQIRIRTGIHTGEGQLGGDNYVGIDVHRAARVAAAAHGGQILLTEATRALASGPAEKGVGFRFLGRHHLKDLAEPETLFQVTAQGLEEEFPMIRTLSARPGNLPPELTSFVGRRKVVDAIKEALGRTRMLSLTGPGGTGKTRLSLQVASELRDEFDDGAFFVPLGAIFDSELVPATIAATLGYREDPNRSPIETLVENIRDKSMILVLDNFEQIMGAAHFVADLLSGAEKVRILVTSREALHISGEHEYPVPPLELPDPAALPALEALSQFEAVALFIERASAVKPDFKISNENAPAVAELCARLDGLPLAIELAAARVKLLAPAAILKRLEHRLSFLSGGARDLPARQQTLNGAIAWSYELLDPEEQRFFAALSVFRGGATLEAIEVVAGKVSPGIDSFDAVASLVNKSLLRQQEVEAGDSRFLMLETIREFAEEKLDEMAEAHQVRRRQAEYFLEFAESAAAEIYGPKQADLLDALEADHDNFRAALSWAESGDLPLALRMGGALWRFWQMRGHLIQAAERLDALVGHPDAEKDPEALAIALEGAGGVAYWMGRWEDAQKYYGRCLELHRTAGDQGGIANALYNYGFVFSIAPGDLRNLEHAIGIYEEALTIYEELGDTHGMAKSFWAMASTNERAGEHEKAVEGSKKALALYKEVDDRFGAGWALHVIGLNSAVLERFDEAGPALVEGLELFATARDITGVALLMADFAVLEGRRGDIPRAAILYGAALGLEEKSGGGLVTNYTEFHPYVIELIQNQLTNEQYEHHLSEGKRMSVDEAVAFALRRD